MRPMQARSQLVLFALANFALVRQSRLSVVPVSKDEWTVLCRMAGVKP